MNTNKLWIDNLRTIATVSVIFLHASSLLTPQFGHIDLNIWWFGNIAEGSARFCVPIFFMVSGALLLSRDYSLPDFINKRFFRVIPPFIFWSLVYIAYGFVQKIYHGESLSVHDIVRTTAQKLYVGSMYHLWFVYTIIGLYLFVPILRRWVKSASKTELLLFIFIWIFIMLFNFPALEAYQPKIELRYFSGYIGYMILGYYLANEDFKMLNNKYVALLLFLIGTIFTIIGTYMLSAKQGAFDTSLYEYLTINVMMSAAGVFLFFKNLKVHQKRIRNIITLISIYSYGIYLIHALILILLSVVGINWELGHPLIGIIITTLACLILSTLIIYFMKKVELLKLISG